jgi:hydrogenase maturation protein HypF
MGRLFDAVAALLGLAFRSSFEAEAAMALEAAARRAAPELLSKPYSLGLEAAAPLELPLAPLLFALLGDLARGTAREELSARFHATLVSALVHFATRIGHATVALSGGCFQNATLLSAASRELEAAGFRVLAPRSLPPGDGALAAGQALAATLSLQHLPSPA